MAARVPPGCPLTSAQYDIVVLLARGANRKQIARLRGCTVSTVNTHLCDAYRRLNVLSAAQAVAVMFRRQWFGWKPPIAQPQSELSIALQGYLHAFDNYLATGNPHARQAMTDALTIHREHMRKETAGALCHT